MLSQVRSSSLGDLLPRPFQAFDVSSHTQLWIRFITREVKCNAETAGENVKWMISSVPHKVALEL